MRHWFSLVLAVVAVMPIESVAGQRVLTVTARDTGLEAAATVPAGLLTVRLVLQGKTRRDLVVRRIPAGMAPEALARMAAGRTERFFQQWSYGGPLTPRDTMPDAMATVDLRPGRYALVSWEVDAAGRPRPDRYVWRPFNAVQTSVLIPARFPVPDLMVKLRDARVEVSGATRPGSRSIQVENVGARPHELIVGRLKPGKTVDDAKRWTRDKGEPPFIYVGGVMPISPQITTQTRLVLQSGTHVVLCALRGEHQKAPDNELGVIGSFKVN
ncbi:MAG TPA: hypothetical protein VM076_25150 [Gemmatimonadaceae bacterium]|nr:hypothetical protein [Gemmatimonadaceae bacterium]